MTPQRFPFTFAPLYRVCGAMFGITPRTAYVEVDGASLKARFGPWVVHTNLANVAGTECGSDFSVPKTLGPARMSFADRGLTMATNSRRGVCVRFAMPVVGIEPTGRVRHPALTVTVADCDGLVARLGNHVS